MLQAVALLTLVALQAPPPPPPMLGDPAEDAEPADAPLPVPTDPEGTDEPDGTEADDRGGGDVETQAPDNDDVEELDEEEDHDEAEGYDESYERPSPTPQARAPSRPGDDAVPPADPIEDALQVDAGTYLIHTALVCGWAVLMAPVSCVPCLSWVLYPGAVGLGVDQIGRYLTDKRSGGLLVPAVTFLLLEMIGGGMGFAGLLAASVALSALVAGSPELAVLVNGTPDSPPIAMFLVYGAALGALAAASAVAVVGATAAWHIAARDDRGEVLFDELNPFNDRDEADDEGRPRRRPREALLDRNVVAMRY